MSRDQILARIRAMPRLPGGSARVLALLDDPEADLAEIAKAVQFDPGLSANTLRMANSAAWGLSRGVSTVRNAVAILGQVRLYQIVVATVIGPATRRPLKGYELAPEGLWSHSVAVAVATREVAREAGIAPDDDAFTAGLLHDVGKLALSSALEGEGRLPERGAETFPAAEREALGLDHAEAGAGLLEHWNFPPALVEAVRTHHAPGEESATADLVHVADAACMALGIGAGRDGLRYAVDAGASSRLNLGRKETERILSRLPAAYEAVRNVFEAAPAVSAGRGG